jgi:hypothetical protein
MEKILEYKSFLELNMFEHAQITYKSELFVQKYGKVYVYGGGLKGNTKEHNPPHFVVHINKENIFRVKIPLVNENKLVKDDVIFLDKNPLNIKDIKYLVDWLKSESIASTITKNEKMSNLKYISSSWNTLNFGDDNVYLIDLSIFN